MLHGDFIMVLDTASVAGGPKNTDSVRSSVEYTSSKEAGFTLVEMLAVAMIVALLASLVVGLSSYVQKKSDLNRVQTDVASISMALERYAVDYGMYPVGNSYRLSATRWVEVQNSAAIHGALSNRYYQFRSHQVSTGGVFGVYTNAATYIVDPWSNPYVYVRAYPATPIPAAQMYYGILNATTNYPSGCSSGQVNLATFDLWSFGPDRMTYVPFGGPGWPWNWYGNVEFTQDDIVNW